MSAAVFGKQGITSILALDCENPKAASLRRTLSADMSSRKWIAQNGLSASLEGHRLRDIADSTIDCPRDNEVDDDASSVDWNSTRDGSTRNKSEPEEKKQSDVWNSILSQKADRSVPEAPYIHPLVKRSKSSLSGKSLEVCTESLGSETGSDGFSSHPSSESGDAEEDKEELTEEAERAGSSSSAILIGKKRHQVQELTRSRSFPPPLPFLSRQNGASLHVRSHRDNGRLVLEAISVKEQNNFRAQREDGRLVLTFLDGQSNDHDDVGDEILDAEESDDGVAEEDNDDEMDEGMHENDMKTEETGEAEEEMPELSGGGVVFGSANKLAMVMNKPTVLLADSKPPPVLSDGFGEFVIFGASEEDQEAVRMQHPSLSQLTRLVRAIAKQPAVAAASYSNTSSTYECFWRTESGPLIGPTPERSILIKGYGKNDGSYIISKDAPASSEERRPELVVVRGNDGNYLVPLIQSCRDRRRSLVFLGPRCVATS